MQAPSNVTEVRAKLSEFIDQVVRDKPQLIKRNRDLVAAISILHLEYLLTAYTLTMEYEESGGQFVGSIEQIEDIIGTGKSIDELKLKLAEQLKEYTKDYFNDFQKYYHAPNRKAHFPYVYRIFLQKDLNSVCGLIQE